MKTTELGKIGEEFAANLLELQGYRILERNFRCKMGEIDPLRHPHHGSVPRPPKRRRNHSHHTRLARRGHYGRVRNAGRQGTHPNFTITDKSK